MKPVAIEQTEGISRGDFPEASSIPLTSQAEVTQSEKKIKADYY